MRSNTSKNISAADASVDATGSVIIANQVYMVSAQCIGTGSSTGSVQLQVSNDNMLDIPSDANGIPVPSHWSNLGTAATITAGGTLYIAATQVCGQYIRAVYTHTNGLAGTITVNINTQAY